MLFPHHKPHQDTTSSSLAASLFSFSWSCQIGDSFLGSCMVCTVFPGMLLFQWIKQFPCLKRAPYFWSGGGGVDFFWSENVHILCEKMTDTKYNCHFSILKVLFSEVYNCICLLKYNLRMNQNNSPTILQRAGVSQCVFNESQNRTCFLFKCFLWQEHLFQWMLLVPTV